MLPGRKIFGLARNIIQKKGTSIWVLDRDEFSSIEKYFNSPDANLRIDWCKCVICTEEGECLDAEQVEITVELDDEDTMMYESWAVVFHGILWLKEGIVETYYYAPDEWILEFNDLAQEVGVTH